MKPIIVKVGILIRRGTKFLMVRKESSPYFMMPGGRPEPGETEMETLSREIKEELSSCLDTSSVLFLGIFEDKAANEENALVQVYLYKGIVDGPMTPSAEIEESRWVTIEEAKTLLVAPSIKTKILPYIIEHRLV
jgi:8-oxo-dGTP diphosphatase